MNHIFLSYSHQDASDVAEWLYVRLTGCGYEVFKDDHSLILGLVVQNAVRNFLGDPLLSLPLKQ